MKLYTNLTTPLIKPAATAFTEIPSETHENVTHVIVSGQTTFLMRRPFTDHNLSSLALFPEDIKTRH